MDHYASPHDLSSRWRTRTLIASSIAAVELLALVGLAIVLLGKGWFEHARAEAAAQARPAAHVTHRQTSTSSPTARTHAPPTRPMLAKALTGVFVLNGNGRNGAAGAEARVLRARGYRVTGVGNAKRNDYAASIVMYRPGYDREARRLARELRIPIVSALDGVLPSQLAGAKALIIVGGR